MVMKKLRRGLMISCIKPFRADGFIQIGNINNILTKGLKKGMDFYLFALTHNYVKCSHLDLNINFS